MSGNHNKSVRPLSQIAVPPYPTQFTNANIQHSSSYVYFLYIMNITY